MVWYGFIERRDWWLENLPDTDTMDELRDSHDGGDGS